jgi:ABC-type multidrug transport system fused ATPase/permease subunit
LTSATDPTHEDTVTRSSEPSASPTTGVEILDELLASAREQTLTSTAVGAELEAVGLQPADAEAVTDQVLSDAGTSLGRDLRQTQKMTERLKMAEAELESTSGDPGYLEAAYLGMALATIALIGIVTVGLVGLLVTAIGGNPRWILSSWFGLKTAGIAVGGIVLILVGTAALSSQNTRRVQASPTAQNVASLRSQLEAKRQTLIDVLVQDWIRPAIRDLVNSARQPSWSSTLSIQSADGLGQSLNPLLEIDTKARSALDNRLTLWAGGSIGVAGPRGAGKSTLIEALCRSDDADV